MELKEYLALRNNWQAQANQDGAKSEKIFHGIMGELLKFSGFEKYSLSKSKSLGKLYGDRQQWGVRPDAEIMNSETERTVFVEIKRQQDPNETKKKGNAHERACKYFAPGLIEVARERGNIAPKHFPFFWIFTDGLATYPQHKAEIEFWFSFSKEKNNFLLWDYKAEGGVDKLRDFFQNNIRPVLDEPR